jgi:DNA-binding response OmpR family regulator
VSPQLANDSRTVLVVEDDPVLRTFLTAILEEQSYSVIAAASGEEALDALGSVQATLAVVDIGLPGMDGLAVAEQLGENVPVIAVTGDPLEAKVRAFRCSSPLTILAKPFTPEEFEAALRAAL